MDKFVSNLCTCKTKTLSIGLTFIKTVLVNLVIYRMSRFRMLESVMTQPRALRAHFFLVGNVGNESFLGLSGRKLWPIVKREVFM